MPDITSLKTLARKYGTAIGVTWFFLLITVAQNQYYRSRCEALGVSTGRQTHWKTLRWCEIEGADGKWTKVMRP
jgi:hypothetical protein